MSIHPDLVMPGVITIPVETKAVIESPWGEWYHALTEWDFKIERTFLWPKNDPRLEDDRMCANCRVFIKKAHDLGYIVLQWPHGDEQGSGGRTWAMILEEDAPEVLAQLKRLVN